MSAKTSKSLTVDTIASEIALTLNQVNLKMGKRKRSSAIVCGHLHRAELEKVRLAVDRLDRPIR